MRQMKMVFKHSSHISQGLILNIITIYYHSSEILIVGVNSFIKWKKKVELVSHVTTKQVWNFLLKEDHTYIRPPSVHHMRHWCLVYELVDNKIMEKNLGTKNKYILMEHA